LDRTSTYYRQVQLLVQLLPLVAEEDCFALKGGTAINLFVRNLPRLSGGSGVRSPFAGLGWGDGVGRRCFGHFPRLVYC